MRLIFFLAAVLIFISFSCQKERDDGLVITISQWEQPNSIRYGFYDSDLNFHHCVGIALVENTISCLDTIYEYDPVGGFYNVDYNGETYPVVADTTYQDFQLFVQVYNGTWATIQYYDVLYHVDFYDGSSEDFQLDGAGIQSGYSANDQPYIHADGKRVTNIYWIDYEYDH